MGECHDRSAYDTLISEKGPRAQIDRKLYKKHMQYEIFNHPNLHVRLGSAFDIHMESCVSGENVPQLLVKGVRLGM